MPQKTGQGFKECSSSGFAAELMAGAYAVQGLQVETGSWRGELQKVAGSGKESACKSRRPL